MIRNAGFFTFILVTSFLRISLYPAADTANRLVIDKNGFINDSLNLQEICDNNIDDDGDGLIDCFDPDCCESLSCDSFWFKGCIDSLCLFVGTNNFEISGSSISDFNGYSTHDQIFVGDINYNDTIDIIAIHNTTGQLLIVNALSGKIINTIDHSGLGFIMYGIGEVSSKHAGAEILLNSPFELTVVSNTGEIIWQDTAADLTYNCSFGDFNHDGISEVYTGNTIYDGSTGQILVKIPSLSPTITPIGTSFAMDIFQDTYCTDCNGLEFIADSKIFAINLQNRTATLIKDYSNKIMEKAMCIPIDWNLDGTLDILSFGKKRIDVWSPFTLNTLNSYTRDSRVRGSPNIGDIDNDGFPELVFVDRTNNGASVDNNMVAFDNDLAVLWEIKVEDYSGVTGITLFDFDQNGSFEIVYRDELNLMILEGISGKKIEIFPCRSSTGYEHPVIADIDNDKKADIIVICGEDKLDMKGKLISFSSGTGSSWADARSVWNQVNYFNVNVNEDLGIPEVQQPPHIVGNGVLNNYLNQYSPPKRIKLDLAIQSAFQNLSECHLIDLTICNMGESEFTDIIPISFYQAKDNRLLNTFQASLDLDVGDCIEYPVPMELNDSTEFYHIIINDAGTSNQLFTNSTLPNTPHSECTYSNNVLKSIKLSSFDTSSIIIETLIDCGKAQLSGPFGYSKYIWSNGSTDRLITVSESSNYILQVIDSCNNSVVDQAKVIIDSCDDEAITTIINVDICFGDIYLFNDTFLNQPGTYRDTFSTYDNRDSIVILNLAKQRPISITMPTEMTVKANQNFRIEIMGELSDSTLIEWSPRDVTDCFNCLNPIFNIIRNTIVTLLVTEGMCDTTFYTQITIESNHQPFYIPNIFSPNSDGQNDFFRIYAKGNTQRAQLNIYDKWGNNVYHGEGNIVDLFWDGSVKGRLLDSGVYIYCLKLQSPIAGFENHYGSITLVR